MKLHRWVGLVLGAALALTGVTGAFNVFYREIDASLNPSLVTASSGPPLSPSAILAIVRGRVPEPVFRLDAPDPTWPVYLASFDRDGQRWQAAIDPANGRVLGIRDQSRSLADIVYGLHSAFLLDDWGGMQVVGILGFALMVSAGTGLYLWWPRAGFWRALHTIHRRPRQRLYLDLHTMAGAWTSLVLLAAAFSGVALVYPGLIGAVVSVVSAAAPFPAPQIPARDRAYGISADQAVAIAKGVAPATVLNFIEVARPPAHVWRVSLRWEGDGTAKYDGPTLWIDPWDGSVIASAGDASSTAGDRFMAAQSPLHSGALLAMPGRIIVFIAGLAPLALFGTGVLAWLRKRHSRAQLSARKIAARNSSSS